MKNLKKLSLLALASTIGLTFGCSTQFTGSNVNPMQPLLNAQMNSFSKKNPAAKEWTIMVHLAADNNLDSFGKKDLDEMSRGLSSDKINVIVLYDGLKTGDSAIYRITPGGKEVVDDGGAIIPASKEIDSGDPKLLAKFMDFAIKKFPANNYMLDIWDHGAGIFRDSKLSVVKSFAYDDHGTNMKVKDLNMILDVATKAAGKKIDIVGFDACLMGHFELAYQMKDYVNILVASEELEPGDGWDYEGWLKKVAILEKNGNLTPPAVASALVDSYGEWYDRIKQNATLSAVDINYAVGKFLPVFNQFAMDLSNSLAESKQQLITVRNATQSFYNKDCADYGDFLKRLQKANIAGISEKVAPVLTEYQKSIIRSHPKVVNSFDTNSADVNARFIGSVAGATGMVVYFPKNGTFYKSAYDDPSQILFAETKVWGNFLKEFIKK